MDKQQSDVLQLVLYELHYRVLEIIKDNERRFFTADLFETPQPDSQFCFVEGHEVTQFFRQAPLPKEQATENIKAHCLDSKKITMKFSKYENWYLYGTI